MLEVKNISFEVAQNDGTTQIIKDLSFTVPTGRLTVITGPNGGGKSTLAKLIMGLEKVTSGQILWNGQEITQYVRYRPCPFGDWICVPAAAPVQGYENLPAA